MSRYGSGCFTINFYGRLSGLKVRWILDKDFNSFVDCFYLVMVQFIFIRFEHPERATNDLQRFQQFLFCTRFTTLCMFFIKINGVSLRRKKNKMLFFCITEHSMIKWHSGTVLLRTRFHDFFARLIKAITRAK